MCTDIAQVSASGRSESVIMKLNERLLTASADVPRFRGNFPRNYFKFCELRTSPDASVDDRSWPTPAAQAVIDSEAGNDPEQSFADSMI